MVRVKKERERALPVAECELEVDMITVFPSQVLARGRAMFRQNTRLIDCGGFFISIIRENDVAEKKSHKQIVCLFEYGIWPNL